MALDRRYYVYAIPLTADVWDDPDFVARNRAIRPGSQAVYVGYSAHTPRCRVAMHHGAVCSCSVSPGRRARSRATSRWVRRFGTRTAWDMGHAIGLEAAKALEKQVGRKLQRRGVAVVGPHYRGPTA